jgi:outer membrane protein OmpA-like peptidoglycan-associated protein
MDIFHSSGADTEIDETGAWLSIGDLMSGLLMIFALLLVLALLQLTEAAERAKNSRIVIIQAIKETLNSQGINAQIDPQTGDISILDSVLFDNAESRLKPAGVEFLDAFVPVYSQAIFSSEDVSDQIQHIVVEGHTSSIGTWDYNMSLSLDRADSVSKAISQMVFPKKDVFRSRLLVSGRGEAEANPNLDKAEDRKVVFRFQFKSDSFLQWFLKESGLAND